MSDPELTPAAGAWRAAGSDERFRGRRIFVRRRAGAGAEGEGAGPLVLFLHGFPSSSFDFAALLERLPGADAMLFDFLGFGLSEKPRDHIYSLLWQADLAEALLERHHHGREVVIVAHDMGTSVATELMARGLAGRLSFEARAVLLFNGSIVLDAASLTWVQKLLRSPLGPVAARLSSETMFRRQFSGLFSEQHPLGSEEAHDQWTLMAAGGGATIGHLLVHYLRERVELAPRWHGAISDWPGDLRFLWGMGDPVATTEVLAALRRLRPAAPVTELPGLGHYPQIEAPAVVAEAVQAAVDPLL